jgi:hypothetical protein
MSDTLCVVCDTRPRKDRSHTCGGCFVRLRIELATVLGAHDWLGGNMGPGSAGLNGAVTRRPGESRPPYRVEFSDARTLIHKKLAEWAGYIAREHFPPLAGPADDTLPAIGVWLRARLPWVSDQPWAGEFLEQLGQLRREAYGLAPWDRMRTDLPLPCPGKGCGLLTLSLYGGDDAVVCRNRTCGHVMTAYEYKKGVEEWMERRREEAAKAAKALAEAAATEAA